MTDRPADAPDHAGRRPRGLSVVIGDPLWIGVAMCAALLGFQIAQFTIGTAWDGGHWYTSYMDHVRRSRSAIERIRRLAISGDPEAHDEILAYLWELTGTEIARAAGYGGGSEPEDWSFASSIDTDRGPVDLRPHIADALAQINHPGTVDALVAIIDNEVEGPAGRHAADVLGMLCLPEAGECLVSRYLGFSTDIEPFLRHEISERGADLKTRARILRVLARCYPDTSINAFSNVVLADENPFKKYLAVEALVEIDDPRTLPAILDATVIESGVPPPVNSDRRSYAGELSRWEAEERVYAAIRKRASESDAVELIDETSR